MFQLIANLLLPTRAVHAMVHHSHDLFVEALGLKGILAEWLPTLLGLALIPFFPALDHPIEKAMAAAFETIWPGGKKSKAE